MRLIDADEIPWCSYDLEYYHPFTGVDKEYVDDMPTVDAEPVRYGKWIRTTDEYYHWTVFTCSVCNNYWGFDIEEDVKKMNCKYCPTCGAKMEE